MCCYIINLPCYNYYIKSDKSLDYRQVIWLDYELNTYLNLTSTHIHTIDSLDYGLAGLHKSGPCVHIKLFNLIPNTLCMSPIQGECANQVLERAPCTYLT